MLKPIIFSLITSSSYLKSTSTCKYIVETPCGRKSCQTRTSVSTFDQFDLFHPLSFLSKLFHFLTTTSVGLFPMKPSSLTLYLHPVFHLLCISSLLFSPSVLSWAELSVVTAPPWLVLTLSVFSGLLSVTCLHLSSVTPSPSSSYAKVSGRVYLIMNRWVPACFLWPPPPAIPVQLSLSVNTPAPPLFPVSLVMFLMILWSSQVLLLQFSR